MVDCSKLEQLLKKVTTVYFVAYSKNWDSGVQDILKLSVNADNAKDYMAWLLETKPMEISPVLKTIEDFDAKYFELCECPFPLLEDLARVMDLDDVKEVAKQVNVAKQVTSERAMDIKEKTKKEPSMFDKILGSLNKKDKEGLRIGQTR